MSLEANKSIAARFFELLSSGNTADALNLLSDDATYWILGDPSVMPSAGPNSKTKMARIFGAMASQMSKGMRIAPKDMIAEGDQVAIEAESYGELDNGRVYNNRYHIRMTIRDGKITDAREYLDTWHVKQIWYT